MPKKARELSALEVSRLTASGKHNTGSGLYLEIRNGSKSWVYRITVGLKRRHIGLGSYPQVSLSEARKRALETKKSVINGIDPIEKKKADRSALKALQAKEVTFKQCATSYIDIHSPSWKNAKHAQQWTRTLEMYAYPVIGDLLVRDIEQGHILKILEPIWIEKTETATRVRNRIEAVLDWAAVSGYRSESNPAQWKGKLDRLLPSPAKLKTKKHHEALQIDDVPAFAKELKQGDAISARCLLFLLLTATRSNEVRGAQWHEVDFNAKVWTIPAERMKAGKEHIVPLSSQAVALLESMERIQGSPYIFPSAKGTPLSDMALSMLMRRMNHKAVPHGLRSTFRDWAGDRTNYARDIAEAALAHTIGNQVEAAYRRSTALEKRRKMMQDWAGFVFSIIEEENRPSRVIKFKRA